MAMSQTIEQLKQQATNADLVAVFSHFDVEAGRSFIKTHRVELRKRFMGNLLIANAEDWFDFRRALKNAYCRVQRSQRPAGHRVACRGCSSCERR